MIFFSSFSAFFSSIAKAMHSKKSLNLIKNLYLVSLQKIPVYSLYISGQKVWTAMDQLGCEYWPILSQDNDKYHRYAREKSPVEAHLNALTPKKINT